MARRLIGLVACLCVAGGPRARAQTAIAKWFAWSPLEASADLPRSVTLPLNTPDLLVAPPVPAGSFWLNGNPATLVLVSDSIGWSAFWTDGRLDDGPLRRQSDAEQVRRVAAGAAGWGRPGRHVAVIGRATFDRWAEDSAGFAVFLSPYGSNPLVYTDTTSPPRVRVGARLEAATAWRLGGWAVGVGAAYRWTWACRGGGGGVSSWRR